MSMINDSSLRRAVTTIFEGQDAVLSLHGRIENAAAFELGAHLEAAIDRHPNSMVLDFSDLDFMGAAGLIAVANAEKRLTTLGTTLTVRAPSALINRLLSMMEGAETARSERKRTPGDALGPEDPDATPGVSVRMRRSAATDDLRRVTSMAADPDVVDGALRLLVDLAKSGVHGADGASVSLLRHGRISTVAASDQTILAMDANQYAAGEGPCIDASMQGHWFHAESLATETRWPAFTPLARDLGIKAIMSTPLRALDDPVGALNFYSRDALAFATKDQEMAALFATRASAILSDARAGVSDTQLAFRFQESLRSREVISLAKGIIMEREGVNENDAFAALLRMSLQHGAPLRGLAAEMVLTTHKREGERKRSRNE